MAQPGAQQEVDLCVLYAYHRLCPTTRHHYDLLRWFNPEVAVVPLIAEPLQDDGTPLPGTVDVSQFTNHWHVHDIWFSTDTFIYRWFLNRTVTARRYAFLEWDVLCLGSLLDFYAPVASADAAATIVLLWPDKLTDSTDWMWFGQRDRLPPDCRDLATGLVPMAGTIFSHDTLADMCQRAQEPCWHDVFSELRLGTLARLSGATIATHTAAQASISWTEAFRRLELDRPGVYHPVKRVLAPLGWRRTPAGVDHWPPLNGD